MTERPTRWLSSLPAALLIALGYYLGAKIGFALTLQPTPVSTLWPPNAILLAGLLLTPLRSWGLVLLSVFVAHVVVQVQSGVPTRDAPVLVREQLHRGADWRRRRAAVFGRTAGARPVLTGRGVSRLRGIPRPVPLVLSGCRVRHAQSVGRSRLLERLANAVLLERARHADARPGDRHAGGTAAACPAGSPTAMARSRRRLGRAAGDLLGGVRACSSPVRARPRRCCIRRSRSWSGQRCDSVRLGASTSLLVCALVAIWGAVRGQGPFVAQSPQENALAIQLFLIVTWIPVMSLAAVIRGARPSRGAGPPERGATRARHRRRAARSMGLGHCRPTAPPGVRKRDGFFAVDEDAPVTMERFRESGAPRRPADGVAGGDRSRRALRRARGRVSRSR